MVILHYLSISLVCIGALTMAIAIWTSLKINKTVAPELRGKWSLVTRFMGFFLVGYCAFIVIKLTGVDYFLELITTLIFLCGALFVLLIINLSRETIDQLDRNRTVIASVNENLRATTLDLAEKIEERIQTEEELRQSKTIIENIFNSSIPICITSINYEIIRANDAYYALFKGTGAGGGKRFCYDSRPGAACHTEDCPIKQIVAGKDQVVDDYLKIDESGKKNYFIITSKPFRNAANELIGIVESFQNITLRKIAEDSLAMEKERLAITLQSIGDGVITTDLNGDIQLLNRVAEDLTGWSYNEAVGQPLEEVFHIVNYATRKRLENPVSEVIASGQTVNIIPGTVLIARDGWERFIADSAAPIFSSKSKILGVVLVFRDISEKRKMESEITKLDKLKSIGLLAGGIAHDFNNLLAAILGNISLARITAGSGSAVDERLVKAEKAVMKAKGLTQQLLTFAKGGAPVKKIISIEKLLRESVIFALRGSNTKYQFEIKPNLRSVEADGGQISQAVNNLIINADQAMPTGGTITIAAENCTLRPHNIVSLPPGDYVKVAIRDKGVGIAEKHLPLIFDPYFTTKEAGSGLGLATVYSIVNRHGGAIEVSSQENIGTTFTMYLPASAQQTASEKHAHKAIHKGSGNILVMDDDQDVCEVAGMMLTELGYAVAFARDGQEAVRLYQEAMKDRHPFDYVILDLTVPGGMGGEETIKELRKIDPEVKAIVSSGYSSSPIMANFREYGFTAVAVKPYNIVELSRIFHEISKRAKG
ncbi:blue-light-activated protein [bacterium BMS3Bbin14]|nr:blue-light-activated protein [bacterium BMS3Abin13]GBE53475.1 blue-light-activated protein [bacterium BMS3Bbin14]